MDYYVTTEYDFHIPTISYHRLPPLYYPLDNPRKRSTGRENLLSTAVYRLTIFTIMQTSYAADNTLISGCDITLSKSKSISKFFSIFAIPLINSDSILPTNSGVGSTIF